MVIADSPLEFDTIAKVKIIARESSPVRGAPVKNPLILAEESRAKMLFGRNDPAPVRQRGADVAILDWSSHPIYL